VRKVGVLAFLQISDYERFWEKDFGMVETWIFL